MQPIGGVSACAEAMIAACGRRKQGSAKENANHGRGFVYGGHVRSHEGTNGKPLQRLQQVAHSRIAGRTPEKVQKVIGSQERTAASGRHPVLLGLVIYYTKCSRP